MTVIGGYLVSLHPDPAQIQEGGGGAIIANKLKIIIVTRSNLLVS